MFYSSKKCVLYSFFLTDRLTEFIQWRRQEAKKLNMWCDEKEELLKQQQGTNQPSAPVLAHFYKYLLIIFILMNLIVLLFIDYTA